MASTSEDRASAEGGLTDAIAVVAVALSSIGQAISMATLIFAGALAVALPRAVASFCVAAGLLSIYVALRSRIVPSPTIIQDAPAIVLVAVAAEIAADGGEAGVADVFAMLAATTLITGIIMWLMGRLHLGGLVRYMPATVIGAFMAGTGWLLAKGGLDVMVGFGIGIEDVPDLFTSNIAKFWIPGFIIAAFTTQIARSDRMPPAALGGAVLVCTAGFYIVVALFSSTAAVEDGGWLIGPFPSGAGPSIVTPADLADARWGEIVGQIPGIVSVIAVSLVVVLLNLTGIAAATSTRFDADTELRVAGESNLFAALMGAAPGFHGLGDTLLLSRLGARSRLVPAAAGTILVLFGIVGVAAIGYVPRLIVGALLVTVGTALLIDWARELTHAVSRVEQVLSVGILAVIASVGVLEGIGVGLVAACAVFIVRYSRVDPIRVGGTGSTLRSRVDRSPSDVHRLRTRADRLAVFELQGYLFFGSLTQLDDRFRDDQTHPNSAGTLIGKLDAAVLDFETVTGMDTSGYALIGQLVDELHNNGALVVLSGLDPDLHTALAASVPSIDSHVEWAPTLDVALELSENLQLQLAESSPHPAEAHPQERLAAVRDELEEVQFDAGEIVVRQGDDSDGMFIIEHGQMTAFQVDASGQRHRLRRFGAGAMVGELGLVTGGARSAEVVADTDVVALWLSTVRYQQLRKDNPTAVFALHEYIMRGQAARVISLSQGLTRNS